MNKLHYRIILATIMVAIGCQAPTKSDVKEEIAVAKANPEVYNTSGLQWSSMDDLARNKVSGSKLYLIDIYTEWCSWCRVMDKKTFSDPRVQELLKTNFNLIKFDAERKDPILFDGKTYEWIPRGSKGNNALAIKLLDGKLSYPGLFIWIKISRQ